MPAKEALWLAVRGEFFTGSLGLLNVHLMPWTKEPGMSLRSKTLPELRPFCSMIHCTQSTCELHWILANSLRIRNVDKETKFNAATERASVLIWTFWNVHTRQCIPILLWDSYSIRTHNLHTISAYSTEKVRHSTVTAEDYLPGASCEWGRAQSYQQSFFNEPTRSRNIYPRLSSTPDINVLLLNNSWGPFVSLTGLIKLSSKKINPPAPQKHVVLK